MGPARPDDDCRHWRCAGGQRIVAIGDVHGAADAFVSILTTAGLIDAKKQWIGGRAILVQTGDMTDRGAGTRDALDLLMSLEKQAAKAGGRVHALLGNHEVMNLTGHMRDASPEIFASFGGEAATRQAFGPDGHYGRGSALNRSSRRIDDTIFMHAGISPAESSQSIGDLNNRVRRDIDLWDAGVQVLQKRKLVPKSPEFMQAVTAARAEIERLNATVPTGKIPADAREVAAALLPVANIGESSLFAPEGPLWFRGYATWTDEEGAPEVAALLKRYRARRSSRATARSAMAGSASDSAARIPDRHRECWERRSFRPDGRRRWSSRTTRRVRSICPMRSNGLRPS